MNTWMPFLRILSAMVCMVKVFPAPEQPKIQMLLFLYCLESKISAMTRELLCLFTPKRIPLSFADTVADEGIAACRPGSQYVPLGQLKKLLVQICQRQGGEKALFL